MNQELPLHTGTIIIRIKMLKLLYLSEPIEILHLSGSFKALMNPTQTMVAKVSCCTLQLDFILGISIFYTFSELSEAKQSRRRKLWHRWMVPYDQHEAILQKR